MKKEKGEKTRTNTNASMSTNNQLMGEVVIMLPRQ